MFKSAFKQAKSEKQGAELQTNLASKDVKVRRSLELAAKQQIDESKGDIIDLQHMARQKAELDSKLEHLQGILKAQESAVQEGVGKLRVKEIAVGHIEDMMPAVNKAMVKLAENEKRLTKAETDAERELKPVLMDMVKTQGVLRQARKASRAYQIKAGAAKQKGQLAMADAKLMSAKARVARKQASLLREKARALEGQKGDKKKFSNLEREEMKQAQHTSILRDRAAEDKRKAQVDDAKASEAESYMTMMRADVHASQQRMRAEQSQEVALKQKQIRDCTLVQLLKAKQAALTHSVYRAGELDARARLSTGALNNEVQSLKKTEGMARVIRLQDQRVMRHMARDRQQLAESHRLWDGDMTSVRDLAAAEAQHQTAEKHLRGAAKNAATEAAELIHRATNLVALKRDLGDAKADQQPLDQAEEERREVP